MSLQKSSPVAVEVNRLFGWAVRLARHYYSASILPWSLHESPARTISVGGSQSSRKTRLTFSGRDALGASVGRVGSVFVFPFAIGAGGAVSFLLRLHHLDQLDLVVGAGLAVEGSSCSSPDETGSLSAARSIVFLRHRSRAGSRGDEVPRVMYLNEGTVVKITDEPSNR